MPTTIDNPSLEISYNIVAANCTPKINVDTQLYDSDSDTPANDSDNSSISSLNPLLSSDVSFSSPSISYCSDDNSVASKLSIIDVFGPDISYAPTSFSLPTFKLVIDNLDKNIKPGAGNMRINHQTKSLHYTHIYAVKDRIDLTDYDDTQPNPDINSIDVKLLLPSPEDKSALLKNFGFLISRVLKKRLPFFKQFGSGLERHIRHKYYEEMAHKSEVVSTCVY